MLTYGAKHCAGFSDPSRTFDEKLAASYYDAEWVYYQIGDYTGDSYWYGCAQAAEKIYRDQYVIPNGGLVPGYWNFSHGLMHDYLHTGDESSKAAAILLAEQGAYARDSTPLDWTIDSTLSREVAYAIMAYLNAETLGRPRRARLLPLVEQAFGHLDQWFVAKNAPYVRPFMVSLTSHALISYFESTNDPRVIPALTVAMDWIWDHTWVAAAGAFQYTDRIVNPGDTDPAPDLNMLIAPVYAWLYHQTGLIRFQQRGDLVFSGGVQHAWLENGKQFNQNYRLSIEYVRLRESKPLK